MLNQTLLPTPNSLQLFHGSQDTSCQINPIPFYERMNRQTEEGNMISKASDIICHSNLEEEMKKYEPGASKIMWLNST